MSLDTPPSFSNYNPSLMTSARKASIPRLQRTNQEQNPKERRAVQACTVCRNHKIKCSSDVPLCKHCEEMGRECVYTMPRKDRLKIVTERCVQMAGVLSELRNCASDDDKARIKELLDAVEVDISGIRRPQVPPNSGVPMEVAPRSFQPLDPLKSEPLDFIDEDLLRDECVRATGFIGKSSEVQWLRTIVSQLERAEDESAKPTTKRRRLFAQIGIDRVSSFSFYTDNESVDPDFYVAPYELPAPEIAERLLDCYMTTVHESFPILPRKLFTDQFRRYFEAIKLGNAPRLSPLWQAILNLVFAIGAKYSHLSKASWRGDEQDHLVYQARARKFGLSGSSVTSHPDVPQMQFAGLLAFYYLSLGQINRAWVMVGTALRFAHSLGLHVRNEDPRATVTKREMLVRIWWSLYSLERLLSIITGRPSVIVDSNCSVPMPIPLSEEQIAEDARAMHWCRHSNTPSMISSSATSQGFPSVFPGIGVSHTSDRSGKDEPNSGSYLKATVQVNTITQDILSSLYTAGTMVRSSAEIQQNMTHLIQRLDQWLASLPPEFNFQMRSEISDGPQAYLREHLLLGFHFYSARILVARPCLEILDASAKGGKDLGVPMVFIRQMATICVESAKAVVDFLLYQPNPFLVYEYGPWWSIVHNLIQAFSVFLLILSQSMPILQENAILLRYSKPVVRLLRVMQDPLAERAYQMAFRVLEAVARHALLDISDLWVEHSMVSPESDVGMEDSTSTNGSVLLGDFVSMLGTSTLSSL